MFPPAWSTEAQAIYNCAILNCADDGSGTFELATLVASDKYCKVSSSSEKKSLGSLSTDECAQAVADDSFCGTRFYGLDGVRCTCIKAGLDCIQTTSSASNSIYDALNAATSNGGRN